MLLVNLLLLIACKASSAAAAWDASGCDSGTDTIPQEGINGELAVFPWLGLLRVYLPEERLKLAVTGAVLVRRCFAIANADDVARIPRLIFQRDSSAMFIPRLSETWFCGLKDYMTHPEYEAGVLNTLALVELDPGPQRHFPMRPICWPLPSFKFDSSNGLYAMGYTDDNKIMEKFSARMNFVKHQLCQEHYQSLELSEKSLSPAHYRCAYGKHERSPCVWEHGMALASNFTGRWTLVGFGVRGPGCSSLARFIDLQPYFPWIQAATNEETYDPDYRRSAFDKGFKKTVKLHSEEEIPLSPSVSRRDFYIDQAQSRYFQINRTSPDAVIIKKMDIPGSDGTCTDPENRLVYRDHIKVIDYQRVGHLSYRLSLFDLTFLNYTCVKIKVIPATKGTATIYWTTQIDNMEGASFSELGATHDKYLINLLPPSLATPEHKYKDNKMQIQYLSDPNEVLRQANWNIYLRIEFEEEAMLKVDVYGPTRKRVQQLYTTRSTTTKEPPTTRKKTRPK